MKSQVADPDRLCLSCSYNLVGLRAPGRCPECGTPIRTKAAYYSTESIVLMPVGFLQGLNRAGVTLVVATLPFAASVLWFASALRFGFPLLPPIAFGVLASLAWLFAVWTMLSPRPAQACRPAPPHQDWAFVRWSARFSQVGWVFGFGLAGVAHFTPIPAVANAIHIISLILMSGALLGLGPVCIYFARLCDWAEDDAVAARLRLFPWTLVFVTIGLASGFTFLPTVSRGIFTFVLGPLGSIFAIGLVICFGIGLMAIMQTGNLMKWVLINRDESLAADRRGSDRIVARMDVAAPRHDPSTVPAECPQRVWSGPANRKPQANYLAPAPPGDEILLAPDHAVPLQPRSESEMRS